MFNTKKTESEKMKGAVSLRYLRENVKEFFVRAIKIYKEALFKEEEKYEMIVSYPVWLRIAKHFVAEEGSYVLWIETDVPAECWTSEGLFLPQTG